jgi:integrase
LKLALYQSGARTFLVYRRVQGRPERIFIGRWPDLTVEQARKIAERINGEIAQGRNPAEQQRQKKLEGTLSNLFERYLELHARPHKQPSSLREDQNLYRRYLTRWGTRRLSSISRKDVQTLHTEVGDKNGHYAANRMLALLTTMFRKAIDWGWAGPSPVVGVKKFREESRERFLTQAEMPKFLKALSQDPDRDFQDYMLLSLLTGARSGNLLAMEWAEVDLAEATWRITRTKGNRRQTVPLVDHALAILMRRRAQATGTFVFPSSKVPSGHTTTFRPQWDRLLERAGLTDIRPHDIRRSLGSWLTKGGTALPVISRALGHAHISTTMIYTRSEDPELRRALEVAAVKMLESGNAPKTND